MKKLLAGFLGLLGMLCALAPSLASLFWIWDETECPESLLD